MTTMLDADMAKPPVSSHKPWLTGNSNLLQLAVALLVSVTVALLIKQHSSRPAKTTGSVHNVAINKKESVELKVQRKPEENKDIDASYSPGDTAAATASKDHKVEKGDSDASDGRISPSYSEPSAKNKNNNSNSVVRYNVITGRPIRNNKHAAW